MKKRDIKRYIINELEELKMVNDDYLESEDANSLDELIEALRKEQAASTQNIYVTTEPLETFQEEYMTAIFTNPEEGRAGGLENVVFQREIDDLKQSIYVTLTYDI